jgi:hypothetical protein
LKKATLGAIKIGTLDAPPADIFISIFVGVFSTQINFSIGPDSGLANADWLKTLMICCLQVVAFLKIIQPTVPFFVGYSDQR